MSSNIGNMDSNSLPTSNTNNNTNNNSASTANTSTGSANSSAIDGLSSQQIRRRQYSFDSVDDASISLSFLDNSASDAIVLDPEEQEALAKKQRHLLRQQAAAATSSSSVNGNLPPTLSIDQIAQSKFGQTTQNSPRDVPRDMIDMTKEPTADVKAVDHPFDMNTNEHSSTGPSNVHVSNGSNCPFEEASWISLLMYSWLNSVISLGSTKILETDDVPPLPMRFSSQVLFNKVVEVWNEEVKEHGMDAKVIRTLYKCFRYNIFMCAFWNLPYIGVVLLQPYFVLHLLEYITTTDTYFFGTHNGVGLAALLGAISVISAFSWSLAFYFNSLGGMQLRGGLIALIFDKSLRLSSGARGKHTTGEIMTLMSADIERMWQAALLCLWLWMGPMIIVAAIILLYTKMGVSALAGAAALLLINFIQTEAGNRTGRSRRKLVKFTEERVKVTNELLQGIRVVKYYAWELPMREKVTDIRDQEVANLAEYQFYKLVNSLLQLVGPAIVSFALFICYVQTGGTLTVPKVYTAYAFLNLIRMPLSVTPMAYSAVCEAIESLARIRKFLLLEEVQELPRNASNGVDKPTADSNVETYDPSVVISLRDCNFAWSNEEIAASPLDASVRDESTNVSNIVLHDISLNIKRGDFVAIVGSVGSGKSSLLAAMLGQMHRYPGGQQYLAGKVSLVSQEHWIQNMTMMENVLFGAPMDEMQYAKVLEASQLSRDLDNLPHGDYTSIGERGINLSGGQKARVSIARALYRADSDIYAFDDSLAAVDVHVGAAIFDHALLRMLGGKTRLVVLSSNYHLLPQFDKIIVMKDGRIDTCGSVEEVLRSHPQYSNAYVPDIVEAPTDANQKDDSPRDDELPDGVLPNQLESPSDMPTLRYTSAEERQLMKSIERVKLKRMNSKLLMTEEDREKGAVSSATFIRYFESALYPGWGGVTFVLMLILFAATQASRVISDIWVGQWARNGIQGNNYVDSFYQNWYIALILGTIGLAAIRGFFFIRICLGASQHLHANLLLSILRAPINTYFDVTPLGRIINRFSKDLDNMDSLLPDFFHQNLQNGFVCLFIVIVCITTTPFMLILLVPTAYLFYRIQSYFRKTSREMKRLDAMSRSPMYSLFSEVLQGLMTIRAFDKAKDFQSRFFELADAQARNFFVFYFSNRWLAIRLDLVSNCVLLSVALLTTGLASAGNVVNANLLGLALVYSLQLTGLLQWTVRIATETETNMTSVERLLAFNKIHPEELSLSNQDWIRDLTASEDGPNTNRAHRARSSSSSLSTGKLEKANNSGVYEMVPIAETSPTSTLANSNELTETSSMKPNWPNKGDVEISNLSLRYRPELGLVLRNLSLRVPGGKRVGICGRTGAGKSSLMLALFRIVTFEPGSSINIDGKDISSMTLHHLRSHLTIIPQDPVMFSGTLRSNLDPFNQHTEAELWAALEQAHLKEDIIQKFPLKLDHEVAEQGGNISVGQRQLICIARALLRRSKIIVMDEATASVDTITDQRIQATIRTGFQHCTVLTIAHRLETIADYDLVAVLDSGKVVEYGSPHYLLTCPTEKYEPMDNPDLIQRNQASSAIRCRGLFLDLVNGLGIERKAVITALAAARAD